MVNARGNRFLPNFRRDCHLFVENFGFCLWLHLLVTELCIFSPPSFLWDYNQSIRHFRRLNGKKIATVIVEHCWLESADHKSDLQHFLLHKITSAQRRWEVSNEKMLLNPWTKYLIFGMTKKLKAIDVKMYVARTDGQISNRCLLKRIFFQKIWNFWKYRKVPNISGGSSIPCKAFVWK